MTPERSTDGDGTGDRRASPGVGGSDSADRPAEGSGDLRVIERLEDVPDPTPPGTVVVVDVIVASTAIVRLLEAGAASVRPFADVDEALAFGETADDPLLVGERDGRAVEGFDCGPLPSVLADREVAGREVGILTTNGTRAVHQLGPDREMLVASTVNAQAVATALGDDDALVVAAGRRGEVAPEDVAGARLVAHHRAGTLDEATAADLQETVRTCETAAWLDGLGFDHEVEALLAFDESETVPRLRDGAFIAD